MAKSTDEKIDQLVVILTDRHGKTEAQAEEFATKIHPDTLDEMISAAQRPGSARFFATARIVTPESI